MLTSGFLKSTSISRLLFTICSVTHCHYFIIHIWRCKSVFFSVFLSIHPLFVCLFGVFLFSFVACQLLLASFMAGHWVRLFVGSFQHSQWSAWLAHPVLAGGLYRCHGVVCLFISRFWMYTGSVWCCLCFVFWSVYACGPICVFFLCQC